VEGEEVAMAGAAKTRLVLWAAMAAGVCATPAVAPAQDAGTPGAEGGRELGHRLRRDLAPSDEIQSAPLEGAADTPIEKAQTAVVGGERPVIAPAEGAAAPRALTLAQARSVLGELDLERRMTELRRCRGEVAVAQRVRVGDVLARKLLVRLTVAERGAVEEATVSAMSPTEPAVLDCVHRKVIAWRFERPAGEPVQLALPVTFRPAPAGQRAGNR
jgi:hypothetical protein